MVDGALEQMVRLLLHHMHWCKCLHRVCMLGTGQMTLWWSCQKVTLLLLLVGTAAAVGGESTHTLVLTAAAALSDVP